MIRKIKKEDAQAIQEICCISLGYTVSVELVHEKIVKLSHDFKHWIYVYEDEETHQVVGFMHAETYESLYSACGLNILGFAVLPNFQGKGIGKKLIHQLEIDAKKNSVQFIRLNSGETREDAHKFYENNGYTCNKTQKRFIKVFD